MKRAPFINRRLPMMLVGTSSTKTVVRTPKEFVKKSARMLPPNPPMKHDVHHAHRHAEPAQPVRAHRLQHRRDHRERARGQNRLRDSPDHEPHDAVRRHLERREQGRRQDQRADEHERLRRVLSVRAVEVATDGIQERDGGPAREAEDEAAMQDVGDVQRVVEVEHLERCRARTRRNRARRTPRSTCGSWPPSSSARRPLPSKAGRGSRLR